MFNIWKTNDVIGIASSHSKSILTFFYVNKPSVLGEHLLPWMITFKYSSTSPWKLNMIIWLLSGQWILSRRGVFNFWKEFFKDRNVSFSLPLPFPPADTIVGTWAAIRGGGQVLGMAQGQEERSHIPRCKKDYSNLLPLISGLGLPKRNGLLPTVILDFLLLKLNLILNDINFRTKKQNKILLKFQWKAL